MSEVALPAEHEDAPSGVLLEPGKEGSGKREGAMGFSIVVACDMTDSRLGMHETLARASLTC